MPIVTDHPDEFTLLRYVVGDTDQFERARVSRHLRSCAECMSNLEATRHLDQLLREDAGAIMSLDELPEGDPFHRRPLPVHRRRKNGPLSGGALMEAYAASRREAEEIRAELLERLRRGAPSVEGLHIDRLAHRMALGYTLDESHRYLGEGPQDWKQFGLLALELAGTGPKGAPATLEEFVYPVNDLRGRAHTVIGWALNWAGELAEAGTHLQRAYRCFGRGSGSQQDFAAVELHESQRRSFLERPAEALALARRAKATFALLTMNEMTAKAAFAEGLALTYLHRETEAIPLFENALEPLAEAGLWSAYASVLNNLASTYSDLQEFDRARRTFAQALRRVNRRDHPGVHAFVRLNLGVIQLRTGRFKDAASAFTNARALFEGQGSTADSLIAGLYEIEAVAHISIESARSRLVALEDCLAHTPRLDASATEAITRLLAGADPDLALLAGLREQAETVIRERLRA